MERQPNDVRALLLMVLTRRPLDQQHADAGERVARRGLPMKPQE